MYGCQWDDETDIKSGFDQYGYDGEDFIKLDLKKSSYIAYVPQAEPTVLKWNNNSVQLEFHVHYQYDCVYWLEEFLSWAKASCERTGIVSDINITEAGDYFIIACALEMLIYAQVFIYYMKNHDHFIIQM